MPSLLPLALVVVCAQTTHPASAPTSAPAPTYTYRDDHDPNGIGKFYMGREIARVMGHEGADWLERPEREAEEAPALLIESLRLKPGQVVADIGAGSGYLTVRLARAVGPTGRVKAVDVQAEMLALLRERMTRERLTHVDLILGTEKDPRLQRDSVDLVLMVDVYHEFAFPFEMMKAIVPALKSQGRVVLVEYRGEDPTVPIKVVHKMTARQVIHEMAAVGLKLKQRVDSLPRHHILVFSRTNTPATRESK
jgi:precorrin-6B methylase 2